MKQVQDRGVWAWGSLTAKEVQDHGIHFWEIGSGVSELIRYVDISLEEFDILDKWIGAGKGGNWTRELEIGIGKGIVYKVAHQKDTRLEVTVQARADCLAYPLEVTVRHEREPMGADEHGDACYYSWTEPLEDEDGCEYIYDELGDRFYGDDAECYCDWIELYHKQFQVHDNDQLQLIEEAIAEAENAAWNAARAD